MEESSNSASVQDNLKIGLSDEVTEIFMQKFDELANKIEELEKSMTKPMTKTTVSRTKKESET